MGNSQKRLAEFPSEARNQAGFQLWRVQLGLQPESWKPMSSIGPGVCEIRVHEPHEHRVIYIAKYSDTIYVLHAFSKKTEKTAIRHLILARTAYEEVQQHRKRLDTNENR